MRIALFIAALALISACGRQKSSAVHTQPVFEQQVKNAVLAGEGDAEIQALRKRLLDSPRDTSLRRRLAQRFESAGYSDLALEHLRLAHEYSPNDKPLALDLAEALLNQRLDHQAQTLLAALAAGQDLSPAELSRCAILLDRAGQLPLGERLHRDALAAVRNSPEYANNLAFNLMLQKRAVEAEAIWRNLLAAKPANTTARNNLASLYATQLSQPAEALAHWKAAHGPAIAHNNLAAAYIEQGKFAEAKAELEQALAIRFQFPEAMANLQLVAARTGGTVEMKLEADKKPSSLSKLAKALKTVFLAKDNTRNNRNQRSHP
jgi:Flp pilus assembly protein TadD